MSYFAYSKFPPLCMPYLKPLSSVPLVVPAQGGGGAPLLCVPFTGQAHRNTQKHYLGALSHGARTVRARCAHGSMFLGWLPNLYPVEWPP